LAAIGLTLADLFDGTRKHFRLDSPTQRRRMAGEALEQWRQAEIRRCAEDLRLRDIICRQITYAFGAGTLDETETWESLAYELTGYSNLEYKFDRLIRNDGVLELWRESRRMPA
jgi:hypothetical protein